MNDPTLTCPNCKTEIRLTESLAAPLLEGARRQFATQLAAKDAELAQRLRQEREAIAAAEADKARQRVQDDLDANARKLKDFEALLKERNDKLAEAQKAQAEVLRKERELEDAKRELGLTVEKQVQAGLAAVREQARKDAEDELKLKVTEKDQTIESMRRQIDDLKRKAEQGSQQLQGEAQEVALEELLRARFPLDEITPVAKGEFGGDILQTVRGPTGEPCGTILWECKSTKNWSDGWLAKLRENQRAAKADVAVIVSRALPKDCEGFDLVDHVWVTPPRLALPVALTLRQSLIDVARARQSSEGLQTKTDLVYQYLTGPRFRQRIQGIVEAFETLQADLDTERKVIMKQWAKREAQIERVMQGTIGMYGDLQGIAGQGLKEIEGLDINALENDSARVIESDD